MSGIEATAVALGASLAILFTVNAVIALIEGRARRRRRLPVHLVDLTTPPAGRARHRQRGIPEA